MTATPSASSPAPVLVATDLTEHGDAALLRGRAVAEALGAPFVVLHVIPDVARHHPLVPSRDQNDTMITLDLSKKAAELVTQQVGRVLRLSADDYIARIELGDAEDEIVRVAEEEHARLIVVGAKPREGTERYLGHVAERVVRYAHTAVLVGRNIRPTRKILVATDLTERALPALRFAGDMVRSMGVEATLVHVMELPRGSPVVSATSALGNPWMPLGGPAFEQLEALGLSMLEGLAKEHGLQHFEQLEGHPADVLVSRAAELGADTLVMGSHGRTGLGRLVLGSVAEKVIRTAPLSVLVARPV